MYYTKWNSSKQLTAFGKCLDDNQLALVRSDVTITVDDKLLYNCNKFDKQEMLTWEQQPTNIKADFNLTKVHFKTIIRATDVYEQVTNLNQHIKWLTLATK